MKSRNSLLSLAALAAALVAPLAFAQNDTTAQDSMSAQAATPATPATPAAPAADAAAVTPATPATPATPETPATAAAEAKRVTWSDLDANNDGKLDKTEVASIGSLSEVFDQADADTDGALTPDEYKAYLARNGKLPARGNSQG